MRSAACASSDDVHRERLPRFIGIWQPRSKEPLRLADAEEIMWSVRTFAKWLAEIDTVTAWSVKNKRRSATSTSNSSEQILVGRIRAPSTKQPVWVCRRSGKRQHTKEQETSLVAFARKKIADYELVSKLKHARVMKPLT